VDQAAYSYLPDWSSGRLWRGRRQRCVSGGLSGGAAPETKVGTLVDGPVANVAYKTTSGLEGFTNKKGEFQYKDGDHVIFSVNKVKLGEAEGQEIVTPIELAKGDYQKAQEIAAFLIALDADPSDDVIEVNPEEVNVEKEIDLSKEGISALPKELKKKIEEKKQEAASHFRKHTLKLIYKLLNKELTKFEYDGKRCNAFDAKFDEGSCETHANFDCEGGLTGTMVFYFDSNSTLYGKVIGDPERVVDIDASEICFESGKCLKKAEEQATEEEMSGETSGGTSGDYSGSGSGETESGDYSGSGSGGATSGDHSGSGSGGAS
jgi:hypothetical protein